MKVINFGSLNIDHVYSVEHFVQPGETIACKEYKQFCGGKGCNQSLAMAQAGLQVIHAGCIGSDGEWLKERLAVSGVDVSQIAVAEKATGRAIIQVAPNGENAIVTYGGANQTLNLEYIKKILSLAEPGDFVLTQNETSCVPEVLSLAAARGLFVVLNPAPITEALKDYPLDMVGLLIVNETEGYALSGESESAKILLTLVERFPSTGIVLTLGSKGAMFQSVAEEASASAPHVAAVDTTAAGDTFVGFFLAELARGADTQAALHFACQAAALCVQKAGAANSIPTRDDVLGVKRR